MGGSSGGCEDSEVRFAPYLERAHGRYLDSAGADVPSISMTKAFNAAVGNSIYSDYLHITAEEGFFGFKSDGTTLWQVGEFPSLYDLFGKFVAGLDVCVLWEKIHERIAEGAHVEAAVTAQAAMLQDTIDTEVMPKFLAGMRDINAVQSSSFIAGKAIIQDGYVKAVNKFASGLRFAVFEESVKVWTKHLDWNQAAAQHYAELLKLYYTAKLDVDGRNYEFAAKDSLWDLNLMNHAKSMLGALNGSPGVADGGGSEPSGVQKALGGSLSGAAAGAMMTPATPWIGGAVGGVIGLASSLF